VSFEYTCVGHPTSDESLGELNAALQGEPAYSKREREHNTVRALADYLLGDGAGDDLFGGPGEADIRTTGRYPKLQVGGDDPDAGREGEPGEQLATMVPQYGTLSFTRRRAPLGRERRSHQAGRDRPVRPARLRLGARRRRRGRRYSRRRRGRHRGTEGVRDRSRRDVRPEMVESTRGVASEVRHVDET